MGKTKSKKPTLAQKKQISEAGMNPRDWRVLEDDGVCMTLVHRGMGTSFKIKNGALEIAASRASR